MKIEFIASVALITADPPGSRELFVEKPGYEGASQTIKVRRRK